MYICYFIVVVTCIVDLLYQNKSIKQSCGILISTAWSVVAGHMHVVRAIHRFHSLETNRAGSLSRQILVLSELDCIGILVFLDHTRLLFSYSSILLLKIH